MAIPKTLLGKVATRPNFNEAWLDISRNAKPLSHGMSEQTIKEFQSNLKENLEVIRTQLRNSTYKFGRLRAVTKKKKSGKKRPLKIADIRDRVVQRAIARVLENYLEKPFNLDNLASYAYIRGKGVQAAIKQMLKYHQEGCNTVFEADIIDFFGSVSIEKLLNDLIFPKLPDDSLNHMIQAAFEMEVGNRSNLPEEDWELYPESSAGLPQGGYLSPLFSNVYLSVFDSSMLAANFRLIRYADDFIVLCKSISEAENAYELTIKILEGDLGLKLHPRSDSDKNAKTRIGVLDKSPIKFLGIQFNGRRIWPDPEKRILLSNKLLEIRIASTTVRKLLISTDHLLEGWIAAYGFTDLRLIDIQKIDDEVNRILWRNLNKLKWKLISKPLTEIQRLNSGVDPVNWYLDNVRRNMKAKDKELFSKYWS